MATKFEVEVFNGQGDFLLWRKKMKAVLVQQKVAKAIDNTYTAGLSNDKKKEMDEIALSKIILHLSDSVLRKVDDMHTTSAMWKKLEELYPVRSLLDRILLLEQFFGFKMDTSKDLDANLDEFNKLTLNLANC